LFKSLVYAGLFFLSARYIYAPWSSIPSWNQRYSLTVAGSLGFHDIELFDTISGILASAIIAAILYVILMATIRRICGVAEARSHR